MTALRLNLIFVVVLLAASCARLDHLGKPPSFTPTMNSTEQLAMLDPGLPRSTAQDAPFQQASLWSGGKQSLLGDRRAAQRGCTFWPTPRCTCRRELAATCLAARRPYTL